MVCWEYKNAVTTFFKLFFLWEIFVYEQRYIRTAGDGYTEGQLVQNRNATKHSTAYKRVCARTFCQLAVRFFTPLH